MALIIISGDELVHVLKANGLIPDPVTDIETHGEEIRVQVRVRTSLAILKSIRIPMRFVRFEHGQVVLQVVTNRLIDKFDWLVDKMAASLPLEEQGARWEYPRLYLDANKALVQQIRGMEVTSIVFAEGRFHITTICRRSEPPEETARDMEGEPLPDESPHA